MKGRWRWRLLKLFQKSLLPTAFSKSSAEQHDTSQLITGERRVSQEALSCWLNWQWKKNHICPFGAWQARFIKKLFFFFLNELPFNKCYFWTLTPMDTWHLYNRAKLYFLFGHWQRVMQPMTGFEVSAETLYKFDGIKEKEKHSFIADNVAHEGTIKVLLHKRLERLI